MNDDTRQEIDSTAIKVLVEHGVRDFRNHMIGKEPYSFVQLITGLNLSNCDFSNSVLYRVVFKNCCFTHAVFNNAKLKDTAFFGCDLSYAKFDYVQADNLWIVSHLKDVSFASSRLIDAKIRCEPGDDGYVDVRGAQWKFGKNMIYIGSQIITNEDTDFCRIHCPQTGKFDGWKVLYSKNKLAIAHLLIPDDAERSSGFGTKCRCDKAKVLDIYMLKNKKHVDTFTHNPFFNNPLFNIDCSYKVGEMIYSDEWDSCRWHECSHGIHFFMSEAEAIEYALRQNQ